MLEATGFVICFFVISGGNWVGSNWVRHLWRQLGSSSASSSLLPLPPPDTAM